MRDRNGHKTAGVIVRTNGRRRRSARDTTTAQAVSAVTSGRESFSRYDAHGRARKPVAMARVALPLVRQVGLLAPVGLKEDAVDLFEVDGFDAIAHSLEHGAEAEVLDAA